MKKLVTVAGFFLLALTVNNTKAQMKSMVGVKGGVSFTSVTDLNGKNRTTGHAGVFYHQELNKSWCIQPEVLYAGAGVNINKNFGLYARYNWGSYR